MPGCGPALFPDLAVRLRRGFGRSPALAEQDVVAAGIELVRSHPEVGAIVLECTNMPPYTADIQRETGRPVFDIVTLVTMVHDALVAGQPPRRA